jgi:orotidine-5'-phosphate decarboxylase
MTVHPAGRERLCVALDVPTLAQAEKLCVRVAAHAAWFKVGLELYTAEGPAAVLAVRRHGRVFLDLKLCDIPETAARAVDAAAGTGCELLTVHAAGGPAMLSRAAEVGRERNLKVLAVTVLTSLAGADLAAIRVAGSPLEIALAYARLAADAGCAGVIASPFEVAPLRAQHPAGFVIVTPGVRPVGAPAGDQKRIATPEAAIRDGADLVVVGRPIRDAPDPEAAARAIASALDGVSR